MKLSINIIIQALGTGVQIINAITPIFPGLQVELVAAVTVIQAVTGVIAHHYNTDGTSQAIANPPAAH